MRVSAMITAMLVGVFLLKPARADAPKENPMQVQLQVLPVVKKGNTWTLKVELSFTNSGKTDFELDNEVGGERGHVSNNVFVIKPKGGGNRVEYRGEMAKRAHPGPKGFTHIKPGEVLKRTVEVRDYAFPVEGGTFTIRYDTFNHFSKDAVQMTSNDVEFAL